MIVCSLPRCGATKYCLDLEASTDLKFAGELNPMYLVDNRKAIHHETGIQQTYTDESFAEILSNKNKYIILVNKQACLSIHECDVVVLRKNMLDAFMSYANFLLKMYPGIDTRVLIDHVTFSIYDYRGIKAYIGRHEKNIVWYEDYYNVSGTTTQLLDSHRHAGIIRKAIVDEFENHR